MSPSIYSIAYDQNALLGMRTSDDDAFSGEPEDGVVDGIALEGSE
jgi:hypothetical protein